ncbi:myosin-like coiled-coil protein-domain-containing protein [Truncatella angustata]|uniref:Myosin-like coiled-coil protein-domain-containing protein n=1 Tax=Truncatella angustata TaxID=152316 RepID=A0A9P8UN42_9PEZI|nr:myosin-like coiled-coil protein-domain-containing protein [Truncatella angustata]KAH6655138.1 myosin-like coiled-coil protein-domain-containing protein [Truncatella angustata]
MATANHSGNAATPAPLASNPITNGADHYHHHDHRPAPTPASAANANNKKAKSKKAMDSSEASKLVAARISQLEVDNAAEKEQQEEIDREVKKHNRELLSATNKMGDLDKIDHLTKKCNELFTSMKRLERDSARNKKRADQVQKEKDASRNEATKQTGLKEKLEKLCRELQKDNNKLKNDHRSLQDTYAKLKKDGDRRTEEILKTLEGYQEEKDNPRKPALNGKVEDLIKARFKSLIDQYELRDLHFHSQMRTKEIEVQYHMARYDQQKKAAENEARKSSQLNSQVNTFHKTEMELRNQLNVYVEKFRQEMEDMSKKTKTLEKENERLKKKKEVLEANIAKMAHDADQCTKEIDASNKMNNKLKNIIKQMQEQGRGIPQGMQGEQDLGDEVDLEEESEYEDEYEEGDEEGSEGEFDDDTEEEIHEPSAPVPRSTPYGPQPPPVRVPTNGHV